MNPRQLGKDEYYLVIGRMTDRECPVDRTWVVCIRFELEAAKQCRDVCSAQAAEFKRRFPDWAFGMFEIEPSAQHQFLIDMFDPHFRPARYHRGDVTYEIHTVHEDPGTRRAGIELKRRAGHEFVFDDLRFDAVRTVHNEAAQALPEYQREFLRQFRPIDMSCGGTRCRNPHCITHRGRP